MSGVVSEIVNELQELKQALSSPSSKQSHDTNSSTNLKDSTLKQDRVNEGTYSSTEDLASEYTSPVSHDYRRIHKQAKHSERVQNISNKYKTSGLEIDSFHHFEDVHLPGDEVNGPPVSGKLGQELLSMLRMARLKVRQERQQQGRVDKEGSKVNRVGGQ